MISDTAVSNWPVYNFAKPVDLRVLGQTDSLLTDLVATPAFQRLKSIRFLGGIDYLFVRAPNGAKGNVRYTRYQHSLGVARLAVLYCNRLSLERASRRVVTAAALLHDIGHGPLSHSLEPVFEEQFGLTHHLATEAVITGDVALGQGVREVLRDHKVSVDRVLELVFGKSNEFGNFFGGPINFDTIEGILRSRSYVKPQLNILSPEAVVEAALCRSGDKDRSVVDGFWSHKDQVYRHIITSRAGVLADFTCQLFMRRNMSKVTATDYFTSESDIFRKLEGLREMLTSRSFEKEATQQLDGPIAYKVRRFFIDVEGDFFARADQRRYKQLREERCLLPKDVSSVGAVQLRQDLFDDDRDRTRQEAFGGHAWSA